MHFFVQGAVFVSHQLLQTPVGAGVANGVGAGVAGVVVGAFDGTLVGFSVGLGVGLDATGDGVGEPVDDGAGGGVAQVSARQTPSYAHTACAQHSSSFVHGSHCAVQSSTGPFGNQYLPHGPTQFSSLSQQNVPSG